MKCLDNLVENVSCTSFIWCFCKLYIQNNYKSDFTISISFCLLWFLIETDVDRNFLQRADSHCVPCIFYGLVKWRNNTMLSNQLYEVSIPQFFTVQGNSLCQTKHSQHCFNSHDEYLRVGCYPRKQFYRESKTIATYDIIAIPANIMMKGMSLITWSCLTKLQVMLNTTI